MSAVFPVNQDARWRSYTASAGQTVFSIPFPFQDDGDVTVLKIALDGALITLTRPADYTMAGADNPAGGSFTLTAPAVAGEKFMPVGKAVLERILSIVRGGKYKSAATDDDLDRLMIIAQEHDRDISRSVKAAFGTAGADLPAPEPTKVLSWSPDGRLENKSLLATGIAVFSALMTTMVALATYAEAWFLLKLNGSLSTRALIKALTPQVGMSVLLTEAGRAGNFVWTLGDFTTRIAADTMEGLFLKADGVAASVGAWVRLDDWQVYGIDTRWCGLKADGNGTPGNGADDAAAFKAAGDLAIFLGVGKINLPSGFTRLGSKVTFQNALRICGVGCGLPEAWPSPVIPQRSYGTWLYFDHVDIGARFEAGATNPRFATRIEHLTTMRNHAAPGAGWAPTAAGADFSFRLHMAHMIDMGFLNPYVAIEASNAPVTCTKVRGQPLYRYFTGDETTDVCRFDGVHLWPYWSLDSNVGAFTKANLIIFDLLRCDNPQISNLFSIRQNIGVRISSGAFGTATRLKGTNIEFDSGGYGVVINAGADGIVMQLTNFVTFADSTLAVDSRALWVNSNNCVVQVANMESVNAGAQAVLVGGAGNTVGISNYKFTDYGAHTVSAGAWADAGNTLVLTGAGVSTTSHGGAKYGGAGKIEADDWLSYSATIAATVGALTTVGTKVTRYQRRAGRVILNCDTIVADIGSGTTGISVTLPVPAAQGAVGTWINTATNASGPVRISAAGTQAFLTPFPVANGQRFLCSIEYEAS
ncbi:MULTISPECIES: hypothetical protein [unclassified Mesorhizobium]|uniref:hypothetical protein n=1 Tax=unclassified Mesorhizobium TaxID=325217 RepID=UPI00112C4BBF|nr:MULTISPECIES: hypothetical protein [unclassified Mesorhizobium]TPM06758.1 hypothetical protein FJ939_11885 [Mesorhizobium sp. B2-3-8]TPM15361.1 hypothetical protein FJ940_14225 [Mesorhizobium sp. B2-3-7]